jgi:hypothetical protein
MVKVPCTCGCGLAVAPSTKQNHLKGKGTTALRARVFAKTKSLTMVDGRQQERQNDRNQGSKKRPASNPDEGGIRKRLNASQLEPNVFQADIDPMTRLEASPEPEASPTIQAVPLPAVSTQSDKVVERTRHAMEQRWGGRQDNSDEGEDDEDEDDEDEGDEDEEDEDEDEDEEENEKPGLSAWDLLGEAFEREAAALGLS